MPRKQKPIATPTVDKRNIVYILTNRAMPGHVKIGRTDNLKRRMKELHTTGVPVPFECFHASRVRDGQFVEKQLHDAFDNLRVDPRREFFEIEAERPMAALLLAEIENVTPQEDYGDKEDLETLKKARAKQPPFNFKMVGIPEGAELVFTRDETVTAVVIGSRSIEYNLEPTSLSKAAQQALGYNYQVQGPLYWKYDGETLVERRKRMEEEE